MTYLSKKKSWLIGLALAAVMLSLLLPIIVTAQEGDDGWDSRGPLGNGETRDSAPALDNNKDTPNVGREAPKDLSGNSSLGLTNSGTLESAPSLDNNGDQSSTQSIDGSNREILGGSLGPGGDVFHIPSTDPESQNK